MPVIVGGKIIGLPGSTYPLMDADRVEGAFNDRGDAPAASTTYATGDVVRLDDGRFRKCLTAGDYTAAEIGTDTTNWQTFGSNTGGLVRYDDHGTPPTAPTEAGQVAVDRGGRVYPAGDEVVTHDTPPTVTTTEISNADWTFWNNVHEIAPGAIGTDGHFFFSSRSHYFFQNQGTLGVVQVLWEEALTYLAGLGETPPANLQSRTWLGFFGSFEDAAEHLARISFRNSRDWILVKEGDPGEGLYIVTAHADTGQVRQDNLFWNPSLVSLSDVLDAADGTPGNLAKIQSYGAFSGRVARRAGRAGGDPDSGRLAREQAAVESVQRPAGSLRRQPERIRYGRRWNLRGHSGPGRPLRCQLPHQYLRSECWRLRLRHRGGPLLRMGSGVRGGQRVAPDIGGGRAGHLSQQSCPPPRMAGQFRLRCGRAERDRVAGRAAKHDGLFLQPWTGLSASWT